jgi:pyruvate/2-oxoglutarate dehydrogenase complex dihydrolipoamide dehydrogenase (E3) component
MPGWLRSVGSGPRTGMLSNATSSTWIIQHGGTRVLAGDQVFFNVGTHAAVPSVPGLEAARPLTHIEALELDYLPPHLIVLGAGYVGLELAQTYLRFGSRVTSYRRKT